MEMGDYIKKYRMVNEISINTVNEVIVVFNKDDVKFEVLKILKNSNFQKIEEEAKIATSFNHENVLCASREDTLTTYDGKLCKILTYQLCDCDLYDYINKEEITKPQMYQIFIQMVKAVQYLHDNGMAHCDVKLENFLVENKHDSDPHIFLTDFEHLVSQKNNRTRAYKPATLIYRSQRHSRTRRKLM
eukprot:TRINITY_DN2081_c0_g2_i1.p1 TRINITY_DN2081_c0_g2~~TRINITY_DN2081_c0_g2_i1.p1  ORF type:complete len:188 (-),score=29.43 TRINITY_DN2081_c0_g2_i1:313-876(-)